MDLYSRDDSSITYLANFSLLGSSAIWGIGISQTFHYFFSPTEKLGENPRYLTPLVSWLCLMDSLRQAFTLYSSFTLYFSTAVLFPDASGVWLPGLVMPYLTSALVACTAQSFFAYRIWILSQKKTIIPILAIPAILFQLCFPLILFNSTTSDKVSTETQKDLLIATLVLGAVVDISISIGLSALLWKHYVSDGPVLKSTKTMLQRMTLFSVNTGMWTALIACSTVIIFFRMSTNDSDWKFFAYFHLLSPLYYTTVLANLNARPYLRQQRDVTIPSNILTSGGGVVLLAGGGLVNADIVLQPVNPTFVAERCFVGPSPTGTLDPSFKFREYRDKDCSLMTDDDNTPL